MILGEPSTPRPRARLSAPTVAVLLGVFAGLFLVVVSPTWVVLAILGLGLYGLSVARIEVGLCAILIATATVIDEVKLPQLDAGVVTLLAPDAVLLGLLVHTAWRAWRGRWRPLLRPASLLLAAFLALGFLSTALGFLSGQVAREAAVAEFRYFFYFSLFFPLLILTENQRQLQRLLRVLWWLAALVGLAMLVQYAVGYQLPLLDGRVEELTLDRNKMEGVTRILPPGESVVWAALFTLLTAAVVDGSYLRRLLFYPTILLSGLGVLLTFYRAFWLAAGVGVVLLFVTAKPVERRRAALLGATAAVVGALLLAPFLLDDTSEVRKLATASLERFLSVAGIGEVIEDESLRWRDPENEYAVPQLPQRSLIGLGFGAAYRPFDPRIDSPGYYDGRRFIHNSHIGLILKAGGLAYLCFMALALRHLWGGLLLSRQLEDRTLRAPWLGSAIAFAPILPVAIAHQVFLYWPWMPVLALLLAVGERTWELAESPEGEAE